jgi:hypothetical protein
MEAAHRLKHRLKSPHESARPRGPALSGLFHVKQARRAIGVFHVKQLRPPSACFT